MKREKMKNFRIILFKLGTVIFCLCLWACGDANGTVKQNDPESEFEAARERMVEKQIKKRGIRDADILESFLKVPRHRFVPEAYLKMAYDDGPLPIGEGQTISQPYIVAYMTQVLDISRTDKILEIGTGSGYQAAILGELSDSVFTIEIIASLGNKADKVLQEMGYSNVKVKIGDGYEGWEEHAPFDAIIVTCAPTEIPAALKHQLKEGGRMVIPIGSSYRQELVYLRKINKQLIKERTLPVLFVPMVDTTGKKY